MSTDKGVPAPHIVRRAWLGLALTLVGHVPRAYAQQRAVDTPSLVFDSVTVVDVEQGKLVPAQRVVITGNHILAVGDAGKVKAPAGAQVVDARGKYLVPGLWDVHTHAWQYADIFYPLFIAHGITGVREPNSVNPLDTLLRWRREILAGTRVGPPRQLLSGVNLDEVGSAPYDTGTPQEVSLSLSLADVPRVVDSLKRAGANFLKMHFLSREVYFAIAAEARRQGIPFGGHLDSQLLGTTLSLGPSPGPSAAEASDSGVSTIDHIIASAELGPLCMGTWGNQASPEECRSLAERFRRNGTWFVPTTMVEQKQGGGQEITWGERARAAFARLAERAHAFWSSDAVWSAQVSADPSPAAKATDSSETPPNASGVMSIMHQVGMPLLAGTDVSPACMHDVLPGLSLHTELAVLVAEGLTPLEALQAATLNPAKMLHATDSLGTVAPGKLADLVLLDANPLADITNTATIRAVVANGRYYDRAALDQLVAKARARAKPEP